MDAIKIDWNGKQLVITESEAFEAGEVIEEIVTLQDLANMAKAPKFHKLARCYAALITFAGGTATPGEIYSAMMGEIRDGKGKKAEIATAAISTLINILMDGAPAAADDGAGKTKPDRS